jgi:hypothetical protein
MLCPNGEQNLLELIAAQIEAGGFGYKPELLDELRGQSGLRVETLRGDREVQILGLWPDSVHPLTIRRDRRWVP